MYCILGMPVQNMGVAPQYGVGGLPGGGNQWGNMSVSGAAPAGYPYGATGMRPSNPNPFGAVGAMVSLL